MIKTIMTLLGGCFILSACTATQSIKHPDNFRPWDVGVVSPSFYPVEIEQIYGINEKEGWTSLIHKFSHTWRHSKLEVARKFLPDYDGFGIPLKVNAITSPDQIIKQYSLPDSIYIYWASLAESKFYTTKFVLTKAIQKIMTTQQLGYYRSGRPCYQVDVVFGLLPGGDAKIWLTGCDKYTYIDRIKPAVISDKDKSGFGVNNFRYKGWIEDTKQRALDHGVTLFPIPLDKIDQVFKYKRPEKKVKPKPVIKPTKCWASKPTAMLARLKHGTIKKVLSRKIWTNGNALANKVAATVKNGQSVESSMIYAWREAEDKGLSGRALELWVIARLSALSDFPASEIAQPYGLTADEVKQINQQVIEFCSE